MSHSRQTSHLDKVSAVQRHLIALASTLTGVPESEIDVAASYHDLGFSSLDIARFAYLVEEQLGIEIDVGLFELQWSTETLAELFAERTQRLRTSDSTESPNEG